MVRESACNCLCFVEGTLDTISKKWSLLVINALGNHQVLRYSELMAELRGISPNSLADTLAELCRQELVRRESIAEIPPKVQYSLTKDGQLLREAIEPLLEWALTKGSKGSRHCVPEYRSVKAHMVKKEKGKGYRARDTCEKLRQRPS